MIGDSVLAGNAVEVMIFESVFESTENLLLHWDMSFTSGFFKNPPWLLSPTPPSCRPSVHYSPCC